MSLSETNLRVLLFSGNKREWTAWSDRYLARAAKLKFRPILTGKILVPTEKEVKAAEGAESKDEALIKDYADAVHLNDKAMEDLFLQMDTTKAAGRVAFSIIKNTRSEEYPSGNAHKAWAAFKRKYEPDTITERLKLEESFYTARLQGRTEEEGRGKETDGSSEASFVETQPRFAADY